jgi:DNA mismatch repair protein MutL
MIINKLPKHIVNILSAGEVVERPYSVVKELVENAIDAKADSIIIDIKNGGKTFIKVEDN